MSADIQSLKPQPDQFEISEEDKAAVRESMRLIMTVFVDLAWNMDQAQQIAVLRNVAEIGASALECEIDLSNQFKAAGGMHGAGTQH